MALVIPVRVSNPLPRFPGYVVLKPTYENAVEPNPTTDVTTPTHDYISDVTSTQELITLLYPVSGSI